MAIKSKTKFAKIKGRARAVKDETKTRTKRPGPFRTGAKLSLYNVPGMTPRGRQHVIRWLERQIKFVQRYPKSFTDHWYTARYLYS